MAPDIWQHRSIDWRLGLINDFCYKKYRCFIEELLKMKKTLYLECYSGISGDMTAAALLDLGADREVLECVLNSLPLTGFEIKVSRVLKSGIDACDFDVVLEEENHDHDMEYLHGCEKEAYDHESECSLDAGVRLHEQYHNGECHHEHENMHEERHDHENAHRAGHHHDHGHTHEAEHHHDYNHMREADALHGHEHTHGTEHTHDHEHSHEKEHRHSYAHIHRGMKEICEIINAGTMTAHARDLALRIFEVLAEAEAKAHNVPVEKVHFHEVGAVDSIVDIVSVAVCLDNLGVEEVIVPVLYEGRGTVRCQHGILPIPVPAVANLIEMNSLNLQITPVQGELVTPTGAAIVAAVKTSDKLPSHFTIKKTGIGAGKRQYECPGILRAMLIESQSTENDTIVKLETNIDDCSGEVLGYVLEKLMKAGAKDVHYIPAFMKKNRPAYVLNVICKEEDRVKLEEIIFRETTTIGIRRINMERTILKREQRTVETPFGEAEVKVCTIDGEEQCYPEYESVARLCRENHLSYRNAYKLVEESCK